MARSLLESSGIEVILCDENLVRLDWQISNFIGGIRLQVEEMDAPDATAILDSPVPDRIDYGSGERDYSQPECPRCGSTNLSFEGAARGAALISLYALAVPIPSGSKSWSCADCGSRWEAAERTS